MEKVFNSEVWVQFPTKKKAIKTRLAAVSRLSRRAQNSLVKHGFYFKNGITYTLDTEGA